MFGIPEGPNICGVQELQALDEVRDRGKRCFIRLPTWEQ
jgi:hypothetical protein